MESEVKREAWEKSLAKELLDDVVQYDHKDCFFDGFDAGYEAASRWHSIEKEGLPKLHETVLIRTHPFGDTYIAALSDHHHLHFTGEKYNFELEKVSRWRYMPD